MGEKEKALPIKWPAIGPAVALSLLAALAAQSVRAADGYLEALKAEAKNDSPSTGPVAGDDDGRPAPRTDDQPQMEEWLRNNYAGSYVFYQRLSAAKRKAVYRVYRSGAEITKIRQKINELLKQ